MLEEILDYRNVNKAMQRVVSNDGSPGIDGMNCKELTHYIETNWQGLKSSLLEGRYRPQAVRKVEIEKAGGGKRMLGVPTVLDRCIQQSIHQWLYVKSAPGFHKDSYGFMEGRNAHMAVERAKQLMEEGKTWIIELDLEKFFDRVNHDKLMGMLAQRITDRRTLRLIRRFLNSGIMEGGISSPRTEGTPQGSPLSPLLSNILLDELDKELGRRGLSFVRYADDCSIYVKSEKAAKRTLASITRYIEERLKLRVNREKSKISRPVTSTLLGFSFFRNKDGWQARVSPKAVKRIKEKIRAKTRRNNPANARTKIVVMEDMIRGWVNYFRPARAKHLMNQLDEMLRTRLRIGIWKQWKSPRTRAKNLAKLGINPSKSYWWGNSRLSYCRIAQSPILRTTLSKEYFSKKGYVGFLNYYQWKTTLQIKLF